MDLLVEYDPMADWSLLDTARLRVELAELFGRPVDLVRERNITNPYRLAAIAGSSMLPDELWRTAERDAPQLVSILQAIVEALPPPR